MWKELNRQATEIVNLKVAVQRLEANKAQQDEGRNYDQDNGGVDETELPF